VDIPFRLKSEDKKDSEIPVSSLDNSSLEKQKIYKRILKKGIANYSLFQRFSYFKWPLWLQKEEIKDIQPSAPYLINNHCLDKVVFSNYLSSNKIFLDMSAMIIPSYGTWSLEIWVLHDNNLYRSSENKKAVSIKKDSEKGDISIKWTDKKFSINMVIFGARTEVDEVIFSINIDVLDNKDASLIVAARPYNDSTIGGITKASYDRGLNVMHLDGYNAAVFNLTPSLVLGGNEVLGDIDYLSDEERLSIESKLKMATLAPVFPCKKGKNQLIMRLLLQKSKNITGGSIDSDALYNDFIDFIKVRTNSGFQIQVNDRNLQNWFNASKCELLNYCSDSFSKKGFAAVRNHREWSSLVLALTRMGFHPEVKKLIDEKLSTFSISKKNISLSTASQISSLIIAFGDYYIHERNIDYLRKYFSQLQKFSDAILSFVSSTKKLEKISDNTIDTILFEEKHVFDSIEMIIALKLTSYLARNLGIFGYEKKCHDIANELLENVRELILSDVVHNDLFYHILHPGFFVESNLLAIDERQRLIERILNHFGEEPYYYSSLGTDLEELSLLASLMIVSQNRDSLDVISLIMKRYNHHYSLPRYYNSKQQNGISDVSLIASSNFFLYLRNRIFIDSPDRLELFSDSLPEWFAEGKKLIIKNAPSRFGVISLTVVCTSGEIQIHFDDIPKYIPPDIMITLPVKAKIVSADDFIVKKVIDNSHIINGWPELVRFKRK